MEDLTKKDLHHLTPLQQGMVFNSISAPVSGVEIEQIEAILKEPISISLFEKAWNLVIRKYDALRIQIILSEANDIRQRFAVEASVKCDYFDWGELSLLEQQEQFKHFAYKDRYIDFDLSAAPLMRLALFRCNDERYRMLWSFHHAILDGRSFPIVLADVFASYRQLILGNAGADLPQEVAFKKFIDWRAHTDFSHSKKYWRETFSGCESVPKLNFPSVPLDVESNRSPVVVIERRLDERKSAALRSMAGRLDVTMHTLFQAAWALMLYHYSRSSDVLFGSTRACRHNTIQHAEKVVGLLINTIPFYIKIDNEESLGGFLKRVKKLQLELRDHEHYPLHEIQKYAPLLPGQVLLETLVVFDNNILNTRLRAHGQEWQQREFSYKGQTSFPLTLLGYDEECLSIQLEYDSEKYLDDSANGLINQFVFLLNQFAEDDSICAVDIPYLDAANLHQLKLLNNTKRDYRLDRCLHQLFEGQASLSPDAIAVRFGRQSLTYSELDARANQMAHYLTANGVGVENLVSVGLHRSIDMVVALYGILKAGAAYLPLDVEHPKERLEFIIEESGACLLLTQESLLALMPDTINSIVLDRDRESIAAHSIVRPEVEVMPHHLAYVIYTSGSTGQPKGVMNEHRGICNRLTWMQEEYQLNAEDRVLQKTPYTFDVSVWEFFWPLLNGATLIVAKPDGHRDVSYLTKLIKAEQVTTLHFVPSMLGLFLDFKDVGSCRSLQRVICSGEALTKSLQNRFYECLDADLFNLYGPTEAAVDVTAWRCLPKSLLKFVPIGYPIANTQIYILDATGRAVPIGVVGELHIGGVQVSRGYLNREDLTLEKFVRDGFTDDPTARLYKSGDLARFLFDGSIEYIGRNDSQIKLNGLRIELGDIEQNLHSHPLVDQAIVQLRNSKSGSCLAALLTLNNVCFENESEAGISLPEKLRHHLAQNLPQYMIPQYFLVLDQLPLMQNGKVDHKQLASYPIDLLSNASEDIVGASDDIERILCEVWGEVFGLPEVSVNAEFHDLGGTSMMMLKIHSLLCSKLPMPISVPRLFQYSTVASLAEFLRLEKPSDLVSEHALSKNRASKQRLARVKRKRKV